MPQFLILEDYETTTFFGFKMVNLEIICHTTVANMASKPENWLGALALVGIFLEIKYKGRLQCFLTKYPFNHVM